MLNKMIKSTLLVLPLVLALGCSKDSESSGDNPPSTITGVFVDSAVSGVDYTCSSGATGVTNASGEFTCNEGDKVSFSIGGITLGEVDVSDTITPYTFFPENTTAALNLAQILQSVDEDNDPSNGISIDTQLFNSLSVTQLDFEDVDFDATMTTLFTSAGESYVSEADAQVHLNDTLAEHEIEVELEDSLGIMSIYKQDVGKELFVIAEDSSTQLIKDIYPGATGSDILHLIPFGSQHIFYANDSTGYKLFKTDGTTAGTQPLHQVSISDRTAKPVIMKNKLYFQGNDGVHGQELWVSDGTQAGTKMLIDIQSGGTTSNAKVRLLHAVEDKLFFVADTNGSGVYGLWVTDGTQAGTVEVDSSGNLDLGIEGFSFNGKLYYARDNGGAYSLWVSDGTPSGTQKIQDMYPVIDKNVISNNCLYFYAEDIDVGSGPTAGLVKIDTNSSVSLVYAIDDISGLSAIDGKLYFDAYNGNNIAPWVSDGTTVGTHIADASFTSDFEYTTYTSFGSEVYVNTYSNSTNPPTRLYKINDTNVTLVSNDAAYVIRRGDKIFYLNFDENKVFIYHLDETSEEIVFSSTASADITHISQILPSLPDNRLIDNDFYHLSVTYTDNNGNTKQRHARTNGRSLEFYGDELP